MTGWDVDGDPPGRSAGEPALAADGGRVACCFRGDEGDPRILVCERIAGGWGPAGAVPGAASAFGPAAAWHSGALHVVFVADDGRVMHVAGADGGWSTPRAWATPAAAGAPALARAGGRWVFAAAGPSGAPWAAVVDEAGAATEPARGLAGCVGGVALASDGERLHAAGRARGWRIDHALVDMSFRTGGWTAPRVIGGPAVGRPALAAGGGRRWCGFVGADGAVRAVEEVGTWPMSQVVAAGPATAVALAAGGDGAVCVFVDAQRRLRGARTRG